MELYGEVNGLLAEGKDINLKHLRGLLESDDKKETEEFNSIMSVTRGDTKFIIINSLMICCNGFY